VGVAALIAGGALALSASAAGAVEYANPAFLSVLQASPPTGFPVSPAALDLSNGPVRIHASVAVTNLTHRRQSTPIQFSVHRILTYQGQDVRDGQPGQPGLTFPVGAAAQTTQVLYLPRAVATLTVRAGTSAHARITFPAVISDCGYYQLDFSTPTAPYSYLASGFTRALGCTSSSVSTTTTPTTLVTTTTTANLPVTVTTLSQATTTSVEGVTLNAPGTLPVTGASPLLPLLSLLCFATGSALLFTAVIHRRPER
jgi:hypothetical protein